MADDQEKTEQPTSKKIQDARQEGNVPNSRDTSGVFTLFVVIIGVLLLSSYMEERMFHLVKHLFSFQGMELTSANVIDIALICMKEFLLIVLPLAIVVAISGIVGALAQFGFVFSTKPLVPDITKLNPIKGLGNLVSVKKLIEGLKVTLKSLTALTVGFIFFFQYIKELPTVALFSMPDQLDWIYEKEVTLALIMLFVLFIFAMIDLVIVRKQYTEKLKMSKQEVKDEMKNMEGDPHIKGKIRQIQMRAAQQRMMSSVPEADVVVTNPTHYAVALIYDEKRHRSPIVVAKGKDNIAVQIKTIARENGVHIVQNPPLARALYKEVDLDKPIPETLFATVAEVLAYVYKMNKGKRH